MKDKIFCKFCDSEISSYKHYQTCCYESKKYYYKQLKLALSLFDNYDVCNNIDLTQFGLDQVFKLKDVFILFKKHYGEELSKIRCNIITGRNSAIAKFGKVNNDSHVWDSANNSILTIKEIIAKHSQAVIDYKEHKQAKSKFKHVVSGHLVPRKDIPNVTGCRSSWEANVYRVLNLEHKRFTTEIPFKLPDIHNKTKRGYQEYWVDFIDIDNFFGYGENTYVEVKGYYDDHAEEKSRLFKKYYPNKKLIFISIDHPERNFHPEINYYDLQDKYIEKIPMWETKSHSAFSHPEDFIPESFIKNYDIDIIPKATIFKSSNFEEFMINGDVSVEQLKCLSMQSSVKATKKTSKFRYDLQDDYHSLEAANLARVFNYENKSFEQNIIFQFMYKNNPSAIIMDFKDIDDCLGFGKDTYIKILDVNSSKIMNKLKQLKREFLDKTFITMDACPSRHSVIDYNLLQTLYQPKILLWEDKFQNVDATPFLYKKALNSQQINELECNRKLLPLCPLCGRQYEHSLDSHVRRSHDNLHQDFWEEQEQIILSHFFDLEIASDDDLSRFDIKLEMYSVRDIWAKHFTKEQIKQHTLDINSKKQKEAWKRRKEANDPSIHTNPGNRTKAPKIDYAELTKLKDNLITSGSIIPIFHFIKPSQRHQELNITPYHFDMTQGFCPLCKTQHKHEGIGNGWLAHLKRFMQFDQQHLDMFYQQAELAIRLFYDLTYTTDELNDELHLYFSWAQVNEIWKKVFSKEENKQRIHYNRMIGNANYHDPDFVPYVSPTGNKWRSFCSNRTGYIRNYSIDYKNIKRRDVSPEDFSFNSFDVCPICGKPPVNHRTLLDHLGREAEHDEVHKKLLEDQINLAIHLFNDLTYDGKTSEQNKIKFNILFPYETVLNIWDKIFTLEENKARTSALRRRKKS